MRSLHWLLLVAYALAREDGWQPIVPEASITYNAYIKSSDRALDTRRPSTNKIYGTSGKLSSLYNVAQGSEGDSCNLYKISMNQELYYQYVEYEKDLPDLKEFTLCMWSKFHNHSDDHPLFSYAESSPVPSGSKTMLLTAEPDVWHIILDVSAGYARVDYRIVL
ncbi:hypothetical protein EVAR_64794_1 [Eumeta japonica]|uniref:Uncharacterized protein n=1 Tax=Eumeta variegata TaxID=151549 RepID=A0A4C1ZUU7_EUMVA|nr:hypothetical protein EVAR_64794_1 [Eumeta japonica]